MHDQKPLTNNINSDKAFILIHGRGSNALDLFEFALQHLPPSKFISLQADNNEWYPYSFLLPKEKNEPFLSNSLRAIEKNIKQSGFPLNKIFILGFSQGACLAAEFALQNPNKYGGIFICSGGLIGNKISSHKFSLEKTPVFIGCSENDPFIPISRVKETILTFKEGNSNVTSFTYPGHSHTITDKEIKLINHIIKKIS